jgi:hypothetical protein
LGEGTRCGRAIVKIKREPRDEEPLPSEGDDRQDWDVTVTEDPDGSLSFVVSPVLYYDELRPREPERAPRRRSRDD